MIRTSLAALLIMAFTTSAGPAHAAVLGSSVEESGTTAEPGIDKGKGDFGLEILGGRAKLAAVPIPAYNESIGWSIGLAVAGFYRIDESDTISPESSTTLFGFYAENRTWAAGIFQQLYLDRDRWRIKAGGAVADVNFQTWLGFPGWVGGGKYIDYTTDVTGLMAEVSRRAWRQLYLGVKYRYMESETVFETDLPVDTSTGTRTFSGLGMVATWDSRDNIFYPRHGYHASFWTLWNGDWIGSDQEYDTYYIEGSGYREYREKHVIAARIHSRFVTGDVPFEDESVFYLIDLRGYTDGRYRADQRHTIQAEYRWNFFRRWFVVGFGGFGWSVDEVPEITWDGILPSAGFGARWRMISDPPVSIGVDIAWGKEERAFYFRIGEAF
jgi:outer membrane protein assembly factor BamA